MNNENNLNNQNEVAENVNLVVQEPVIKKKSATPIIIICTVLFFVVAIIAGAVVTCFLLTGSKDVKKEITTTKVVSSSKEEEYIKLGYKEYKEKPVSSFNKVDYSKLIHKYEAITENVGAYEEENGMYIVKNENGTINLYIEKDGNQTFLEKIIDNAKYLFKGSENCSGMNNSTYIITNNHELYSYSVNVDEYDGKTEKKLSKINMSNFNDELYYVLYPDTCSDGREDLYKDSNGVYHTFDNKFSISLDEDLAYFDIRDNLKVYTDKTVEKDGKKTDEKVAYVIEDLVSSDHDYLTEKNGIIYNAGEVVKKILYKETENGNVFVLVYNNDQAYELEYTSITTNYDEIVNH